MLSLAWSCYGRKNLLYLLVALLLPEISVPFLEYAVGEGPEVWAAAASVAGLAILVASLHGRSVWSALMAGTIAGVAEWFRTGNLLLFAVPCAVYAVVYLAKRDCRGFCLPAGAHIRTGHALIMSLYHAYQPGRWDVRHDHNDTAGTEKARPIRPRTQADRLADLHQTA
jgi:hypothetical protein